ncbi:MAG: hypothetical protein JNM63_00330, partial [Spirochaetia bacterium]|nr:hypothetical protein [Spirochaetia bacterium]
ALDLAVHDIAGIASRLITEELQLKKGTADPAHILETSRSILNEIMEKLRILRNGEPADHDLDRITGMLENKGDIVLEVPRARVHVRLEIFLSILYNLVDNAREAYLRTRGSLEGLRIHLCYRDGSLLIEDTAGGFDIQKIGPGVSGKSSKGNGIFLHTLLRDAPQHGLEVTLERLPDGTRVGIRFQNAAG